MSGNFTGGATQAGKHRAFLILGRLCVGVALLGLVAWNLTLEARLESDEARISLLLSCTSGVSEAHVLQEMGGSEHPRYLDMALLATEFPGLKAPPGGHGLLFDSYKASELLGNPHVHGVLLVVSRYGQVCGVMFDTH